MCTSFKNLPLFPERIEPSAPDPFFFEALARKNGYNLIAGVDEAGRGPLAGPVVAAAVILPQGIDLPGVRDSKKMAEKSRREAFSVILSAALAAGIGVVSSRYIDEFNILKAALEAMKRAILALDHEPDFLLIDGIQKVSLPTPQECLKKGDARSRTISAASVLAKVYRDRIMLAYHNMYPHYGFDRHKGYGTKRHMEALRKYGPSPVHRLTFKGVKENLADAGRKIF